jgi:hypothetical protein
VCVWCTLFSNLSLACSYLIGSISCTAPPSSRQPRTYSPFQRFFFSRVHGGLVRSKRDRIRCKRDLVRSKRDSWEQGKGQSRGG